MKQRYNYSKPKLIKTLYLPHLVFYHFNYKYMKGSKHFKGDHMYFCTLFFIDSISTVRKDQLV